MILDLLIILFCVVGLILSIWKVKKGKKREDDEDEGAKRWR